MTLTLLGLAWLGAATGCAIPIIGARSRTSLGERAARVRRDAPSPAAALDSENCYRDLSAGHVAFERVETEHARGVKMPARLLGPIGGISVNASDGRPLHAILDCRLALTLLWWAPELQRAGITEIEHYSIYRPGSRVHHSGRVSGHARGLAIDAARFHLRDGEVLDVLTDWEERDRGGSPCPMRQDEAWGSRLLRRLVCDAADRHLFQVVITPHRDHEHDNHVHLELKPEVSWTYIR